MEPSAQLQAQIHAQSVAAKTTPALKEGFTFVQWVSLTTQLTQRYPNAAARCLIDILNEPDAFKLQWQPQNGLPGVADLYLSAMDAMYPVNNGDASCRLRRLLAALLLLRGKGRCLQASSCVLVTSSASKLCKARLEKSLNPSAAWSGISLTEALQRQR